MNVICSLLECVRCERRPSQPCLFSSDRPRQGKTGFALTSTRLDSRNVIDSDKPRRRLIKKIQTCRLQNHVLTNDSALFGVCRIGRDNQVRELAPTDRAGEFLAYTDVTPYFSLSA